MKRDIADDAFSKCLREAHDNTCEMCGKIGRMECSHVFSRRHMSIRYDKLNANCLCNGCHRKWHESPLNSAHWFKMQFGEARYDLLVEKRNQIAKGIKSEKKAIAKHYREQLKLIQERRESGEVGYIDFISYQ
ncbi:NinG protein [Vibrio phage 1.132.O._10N.222.49.F8]|nr:NinG protein [Vibrio phage 1.132.O._10N.222.49.F8]AUR91950.1 NinG protein [Vibrio phage 1.167.O._10N.261.51.F2]